MVVLSCSAGIKGFPLLRDADSEGGHPLSAPDWQRPR